MEEKRKTQVASWIGRILVLVLVLLVARATRQSGQDRVVLADEPAGVGDWPDVELEELEPVDLELSI